MKRPLLAILLAVALVLFFTVTAATYSTIPADTSRYDVAAERAFDGTVARAGHVVAGTVFFTVKTAQRELEAELGPKEFIQKSGFRLTVGEAVTVVGAPAMFGGKEILLAREVRTAKGDFVLRDRNGEPQWDPARPIQADPNVSDTPLCEMVQPWS